MTNEKIKEPKKIWCEKRGREVEGCICMKFCDADCELKPKKRRKKNAYKNKKAKTKRA